MADWGKFTKGAVRGFGADTLGGPVDAAEQLVNLLMAGGGTLAHKAGLIKADQLPTPLKGSPGTSDWWAKASRNEDDGSAEYSTGRLSPLLTMAPAAAKAAGSGLLQALATAPTGKAAQRGAIRVGGREDLMPSHTTGLSDIMDTGLPSELYSPSLAISKNDVPMNFGGGTHGTLQAIPKIGAFDPAYSNSTLFNRDAYTPRWGDYQGRRSEGGSYEDPINLRLNAKRRLMDRDAGWLPSEVRSQEQNLTGGHGMMVAASPHFRSFKQYESDARGAKTLDRYASSEDAKYVSEGINTALRAPPELAKYFDLYPKKFSSLSAYEKRIDEIIPMVEATSPEGQWLANTKTLIPQLRADASKAPSEYGELKLHGPVGLNRERFAGLLIEPPSNVNPNDLNTLKAGATDAFGDRFRILTGDETSLDRFKLADELQKLAGPVKERSFKQQKQFPGWRPGPQSKTFGVPETPPAPFDFTADDMAFIMKILAHK